MNGGLRECELCHADYHSYNQKRRFCSQRCANIANRRIDSSVSTKDRRFVNEVWKLLVWPRRRNLVCVKCGITFTHSGVLKYCRACTPYKKQTRYCGHCKVILEGMKRYQKYCSRTCYSVIMSERQKGSKSHLWRGGLTSEASRLRNSAEYDKWRQTVFERDDFTCQLCLTRGGNLCAHHIEMFSKSPKFRLFVPNGVTLCWPCHLSIKGKESEYEIYFKNLVWWKMFDAAAPA